MFGVLKRRWKPKRASNGEITTIEGGGGHEKPRLTPSARQVHPVSDEKTHVLAAYEKNVVEVRSKRGAPPPPMIDLNASPPPYPKRASLESNPSPTTYPLAPNIVVEGGRIEFAKQPLDGGGFVYDVDVVTPPATPRLGARITVTRGQQTIDVEGDDEKCDEVKEQLEIRVLELETALEMARKTELKDKQALAKIQRQLSRREATQRDADRERRMRADSEARAKQAVQEAARCRSRLKLLTSEFARMEESVRSMLVYKKQAEQLRQEKIALTAAFENRCQQYQNTVARLNQEIFTLRQQLEQVTNSSQEGLLQAQSAALHRQAEESRKQYERCLDDVANQVVKALLAQKGLREEVGNLNNKILELENQNRALTSMLVHQLRGDISESDQNLSRLALEDKQSDNNTSADVSPTNLMKSSLNFKNCSSFNSEFLLPSPNYNEESSSSPERVVSRIEKRLSAGSDILDTRFSLEDKKRHQVLTRLWTELKGTEVTPKRLIEALSSVDSTLWVPPQRPVSLNLQLPILQAAKYRRSRPVLAHQSSNSKSEEETTGNESPESNGNRDEGYSTMSSDVQAEVTRGSGGDASQGRGLEDLKEEELLGGGETRLLVTDNKDPDILYIPFNLLNLKPRNSFPPGKDIIPFQHIVRSFSDSHLCIKITTSPSPYYTFTSPISSSPSIVLVDITEKTINPLRRTKGTASLLVSSTGNPIECLHEETTSPHSWSSIAEERLECSTWDAEYIQHWLRLDETRTTLQQHRDLFELEYDRTELEDWSLSLSNDDIRENWKRDATTPGQISLATLPSIQENNTLELEEDSNECLWNNPSYLMDKEGHEIVTLLMDNGNTEKQWPYAINNHVNGVQNSPDNSWSSGGSDCCPSHEPETCSKRSSAALSGCSDDTGELPMIGTDFTRDFYRLVKFESTKSLASTSSRSLGGALSEAGDRDTALQNVLTFIAEQQKYVTQQRDNSSTTVSEITKEFNIEAPPQERDEIKLDCDYISNKSSSTNSELSKISDEENVITVECKNEQNLNPIDVEIKDVMYAEEICLVTPIDIESENCSNLSEQPVDICSSVSVEIMGREKNEEFNDLIENDSSSLNELINDLTNSDTTNNMSESMTSSNSTPDTVISKIPRRKYLPSKIPVSPAKNVESNSNKIKSKIPAKNSKISRPKTPAQKQKLIKIENDIHQAKQHVITAEKLPQPTSGVISNIIDGPPHRAVSFHERATSKDVIDELNRMIKNGEEGEAIENVNVTMDEACRPTGWVHVEQQEVDLNDPKARANILDIMMTSVSSDSSPTSSCGGSVTSESTEEPPDYGQLHRIHRFHRQKKASSTCTPITETAV
ncbi:putative leucine-rich repeat-containing protein DDB_G0290503 isoform X2 [Onthophagus taurus]|uniref:putative leucine-rich repeat-containing protein DDB_G0290503 isoform X2 n=1 Tax=Onthophagus taurus TaxID=166361 RepID=UPI000C2000ED|nr:uncharacterized protein LOC111427321 isoform X2 [Onthophagus taurus]